MSRSPLTRRSLLAGLSLAGAGLALPAVAQPHPLLEVVKDPGCGCCGAWIDIMQAAGFPTKVYDTSHDRLAAFKAERGVSPAMASCHTALIEGYVIEGHVPAADILRLLSSGVDAIGLAVPGMPWGSPGMGPETEREAYSVYLIGRDGGTRVFSHYKAA